MDAMCNRTCLSNHNSQFKIIGANYRPNPIISMLRQLREDSLSLNYKNLFSLDPNEGIIRLLEKTIWVKTSVCVEPLFSL